MSKSKVVAKARPGQPTKFNPERCNAIIDAVSRYIPITLAVEANGICRDTYYEWLKIAKEDKAMGKKNEYTMFSDNIKRVEMEKIAYLCSNVEAGANRWQSNAWLLERRWREHFGADAGIIQELQAMFNDLKAKFDAKESK